MGEITKISKASTNSISLRTTIPQSVVTHFKMKMGDKLDWEIKAHKNNLIINIKLVKKRKYNGK